MMHCIRALLLLSMNLSVAFGAADVISPPEGVTRVATVEGINEYRLANGLRILLATDASKPTTTVNVTYLVGSRNENYGETGMAHLLEHLLFKGTPTLQSLFEQMTSRGMQMNGTTGVDRTTSRTGQGGLVGRKCGPPARLGSGRRGRSTEAETAEGRAGHHRAR